MLNLSVDANRAEFEGITAARASLWPFCTLTLPFALEESKSASIKYPMALLAPDKVVQRVERIEKRLKVCCSGLLEFPIEKIVTTKSRNLILNEHGNKQIQYIHRMALDFLSDNQVLQQLLDATRGTDFNPNTSLLKIYILRSKTSSMVGHFSYDYLAKFSLHTMQTKKSTHHRSSSSMRFARGSLICGQE
jgi:hypothetical protein